MITEAIITLFIAPIAILINLLPATQGITIPDGISGAITSLVGCVGYVMPIKQLLPIVVGLMGLALVKIVWALIIRVKSFIPTMGG